MSKKERQIRMMRKYFIDATVEIIEMDGIKEVTARKIAKKAGYTSSSIYNYFDELSHLIFFASMRFTKDYLNEATPYLMGGKNAIDSYLLTWKCFCKYSFKNPEIYHAIFIADLGENPQGILEQYYSIYEEDIFEISSEYLHLVFEHDISKRSRAILERAAKEGYLYEENIDEINEMGVLIWTGMLTRIINNRSSLDIDEAVNKTMTYMKKMVFNSIDKSIRIDLTFSN